MLQLQCLFPTQTQSTNPQSHSPITPVITLLIPFIPLWFPHLQALCYTFTWQLPYLLQNGFCAAAIFKANGVADLLAQHDIHLVGHALGHAHGGHAPGLGARHAPLGARQRAHVVHTPLRDLAGIECRDEHISNAHTEFVTFVLNLKLIRIPQRCQVHTQYYPKQERRQTS